MTFGDYIETQLFQPLGMSRANSEIIPRRAHGYSIQNDVVGRAHSNPYILTVASGAICSTTGDLIAWLQALQGGRVLSPRSYAEMTSPSRLEDGTPLSYGLGMQLNTDVRGRRCGSSRAPLSTRPARAGDTINDGSNTRKPRFSPSLC
jgi:CubicO group peptidase (beta-lactamase class C family)